MFIGLLGAPGSATEKILDCLVQVYHFTEVCLDSSTPKYENAHTFSDSNRLLNYITSNWRGHFVMQDVDKIEDMDTFIKRPFCMLITVDSNILLKFTRYKEVHPTTTLEQFCGITDEFYTQELLKYQDQANLRLINNVVSDSQLFRQIKALDLLNPNRLRPAWDSYFMHFTDFAAKRSNCMRRRVGCVIVRNNRIIATGYNGTAKNITNCNEGGCKRCNDAANNSTGVGLNTCLCLHAEENALLEAGRNRVEDGAILYCNTCPCLTCTIKIVQCGIKEVIYSQSYSMDELSANVFREAGVKIRQFVPPAEGTLLIE